MRKLFELLFVLCLCLLFSTQSYGKNLGRSRAARLWLREVDFELSPLFLGFERTKRGLGLEWTATRRHGTLDDRFSLAVTRLEMEDPGEDYRFRFARFRFERRSYIRHRFYLAGGGGWHYFHPRTAIRDWQHEGGCSSSSRFEPYVHLALAWQLGRFRFRKRWIPLSLRAEYLRGRAYAFDRPLPTGVEEVDPTGFRLGLRTEFRF